LTTLLLSLQSLLQEPNPDDGLLPDVSRLYRENRQAWWDEAKRRLVVTATNSSTKQAKADIANTESNLSEKWSEPAMVAEGSENNETKGSPDPKRLKTG
jgi:hypothetical protein